MGSFVMIGGVLISLFIAFNGYKLRSYFDFAKIVVGAAGLVIVYCLHLYSQSFPLRFTPFAPFIKSFSKFLTYEYYLAVVVAVVLAIVVQKNYTAFAAPFGTLLFYALLTRVLLYYFDLPYPLLMLVGGAFGVVMRLLFKEKFTLIVSAVGGSMAASLLFKTFYYLPWWLFAVLALLFSLIALYIQYRSWQKR